MKIALLHFTAPPVVGGVESVLLHHARLMTESGHEVTIFAGRGQSFDPAIQMQVQPLFNSRNPEVLAVKRSWIVAFALLHLQPFVTGSRRFWTANYQRSIW